MILYPYIRLQLSMAARKKAPAWIRALSVVLFLDFLIGAWSSGFKGQNRLAVGAFGAFSIMLSNVVLIGPMAILQSASNCINSELRQGTLGLLLHTRSRSMEIIVGKFAGLAAIPLYSVLATVPAFIGILVYGSISWPQFGFILSLMVLWIGLLLAIGILASCIVRGAHLAFLLALSFLLFQVVAPLVIAQVVEESYNQVSAARWCAALSPACALGYFTGNNPRWFTGYWLSMGFGLLEIGGCLLAARCCLRRAIVEGNPTVWTRIKSAMFPPRRSNQAIQPGLLWRLRHGSRLKRKAWRRQWLDRNPFYWLCRRDRLEGMLTRAMIYAGLLWWLFWFLQYSRLASDDQPVAGMYANCLAGAFILQELSMCLLAMHATVPISELRLNGLLETVAFTPASTGIMVQGHRLILLWQLNPSQVPW